jgi:hypothetical protein
MSAIARGEKAEILTFHCDSVPSEVTEFKCGPPVLPWECPKCSQAVTDGKELSYDVRLIDEK